MGSGTTRKYNDSVIINRPKIKKGTVGGIGGGRTGSSEHDDINKVCPLTFQVALNPSKTLPERAKLYLQDGNVMCFGTKVGSLGKVQLATINRCAGEGITYIGEVVGKGDRKYGLFKRR
mgnify:CR=1 FL=1